MVSAPATRRLILGAACSLTLGAGCVRHVNFAQQIFIGDRAYNVMYEGPKRPVFTKMEGGIEVQFDGHDVKAENDRILVDGREIAIDPGSRAVDVRVTRERFRVVVSGQ